MEHPEVLVIGAGPAGYVCAIRLAQLGKKVLIVDNGEIGGVCLNRGCIPTKALLHYTTFFSQTTSLGRAGIKFSNPEIDFKLFNQYIQNISSRLRKGVEYLFQINGVKFLKAKAKFIDNKNILLTLPNSTTQTLTPEYLIIATGSKSAMLADIMPDFKNIITSDEALVIATPPKNFIIIGAGAIGLEFATIYARLGSQVKIIEIMPQILPGTDQEIANRLMQIMIKQGIKIYLSARVLKISKDTLSMLYNNKEEIIEADKILVAIGREPNTDGLGLENTGIKLTDKNYLKVNEYFETTQNNIYAIGDVIGHPLLAHKAMAQGIYVAEKISGKSLSKPPSIIPNCIYTDPELATVGLTESEAKNLGYETIISKAPLSAIGRAHTLGQIEGIVKIIIDKKTDQILGAHILAPEASALINEITLAMRCCLKAEQILNNVHPHPTISEAIVEAIANAYNKAIHLQNR